MNHINFFTFVFLIECQLKSEFLIECQLKNNTMSVLQLYHDIPLSTLCDIVEKRFSPLKSHINDITLDDVYMTYFDEDVFVGCVPHPYCVCF